MKVLLDNCVHRRFGALLSGHEIAHASQLGWADLQNGKLLDAAEASDFDVVITVDENLRYQQNLAGRRLALVTLDTPSVDLATLTLLAPRLSTVLDGELSPGTSISVTGD